MNRIWVLDASIAVKWFFSDELLRDKALAIREELLMKPDYFVVPPLFYSEVLHVLTRKSGKNFEFIQSAFELLWSLGLRTVSLSNVGFEEAIKFSCKGLSGYDATYLALANELNACWVSADNEVIKKIDDQHWCSLSAWQEPR